MTIFCKVCNKEFDNQITHFHLKEHGLTVKEYKKLYKTETISTELKKKHRDRGIRNTADKVGKPLPKNVIDAVRKANTGRIPYNKGKKVTDPEILKNIAKGAENREAKYDSGELTRSVIVKTDEQKKTLREIRKNQKNCPENNPEITKKAQKTLKVYQKNKKINYNIKMNDFLFAHGYKIIGDLNDPELRKHYIKIEHISCGTVISRNAESKFPNDMEKLCPACYYDSSSRSKSEAEMVKYIKTLLPDKLIIQNDREQISPLELDVYIPELNIAIEFCGLYWHSQKNNVDRFYHQRKWKIAREKGIYLIQIFEDEWLHKNEISKHMLKDILTTENKVLDINECECKILEESIALDFMLNNHINGIFRFDLYIGLFHEGKLVSLMSFKEKTNNSWEFGRFIDCSYIHNTGNRLIEEFIKLTPLAKELFTYIDNRWFDNKIGESLNMNKISDGFPVFWFVKGSKRFHNLNKEFNESDEKHNKIADCGSTKWSLTLD